jgi:hypothetical protein
MKVARARRGHSGGGGSVVIDDERFAKLIANQTARIAGVLAVTLGGSRAQGEHRPDSDWDFGLYYRGRLDPDDVRALGWAGTVFAPGEWGGGVMNGGAWLSVEGRRVDLHYRDLDEVQHHLAEAEQGRFRVERLPFYLAGIPTYVVVGELAIARVLVGALPRPGFPQHCVNRRPGSGRRPRGCRWTAPSRSTRRGGMRWAARVGWPGRWWRPRMAGWPPGACGR